jgi:4-amino-4-deoxy-L-arabinose transferase-like glycosyltransferase
MNTRWISMSLIVGLALYGLLIHGAFIAQVRDPIFSPDSVSYAEPAINLFFGKSYTLDAQRTPVYSFFLYIALKITRSFLGILIVQHAVAVMTGLIAGFLYYRFFRPSWLGAACVAFLSSSLPLPAVYAHYVLTETFYTFLFTGTVLLFLVGHTDRRRSLWALIGVLATMTILTRPTGRALIVILMLLPFLDAPKERHWKAIQYGAGTVTLLLLLFSFWNYAHFGFFGLDRMKNIALFSTTARYLDPHKIKDPKVRDILLPVYAHHTAEEFQDGSWVYGSPDGPLRTLSRFYPDSQQQDALCSTLAWQGIRQQPIQFIVDRMKIIRDFFMRYAETPLYYLIPEGSYFVYQGLRIYGEIVDRSTPRAWALLHYGPEEATAYLTQMRLFPTGRPSGQLPFVPRSPGDTVYHFDRVLIWWRPLALLIRYLRFLPLFALAAASALRTRSKTRYPVLVLVLALGLHVAVSSMAAWQDWRFVVPVLPLYFILAVAGLQALTARFFQSLQK